jgi:hypothetical protein
MRCHLDYDPDRVSRMVVHAAAGDVERHVDHLPAQKLLAHGSHYSVGGARTLWPVPLCNIQQEQCKAHLRHSHTCSDRYGELIMITMAISMAMAMTMTMTITIIPISCSSNNKYLCNFQISIHSEPGLHTTSFTDRFLPQYPCTWWPRGSFQQHSHKTQFQRHPVVAAGAHAPFDHYLQL